MTGAISGRVVYAQYMKAVLFDMDGVLVDSEEYWVELEEERVLPEAVGEGVVEDEEITGMNYREIYDYLEENYADQLQVDRETLESHYEAAAEELYGERVALLSGFEELAEELQEQEVNLAVVSSSPHDWIDIVLDRFGIREHFDGVVSGNAVDGRSKPEPLVYEEGAAALDVDPADCVAIEDSENGIESANRAGMTSIAYRTDINPGMDFSGADVVAEGPEDLRETVLAVVDGETVR